MSDRAAAQLIVLSGTAAGRRLEFRDRVRIGSAPDCDLVLAEAGIAAEHATIEPSDSGYRLHATAGVVLDGQAVLDVDLASQGILDLGDVTMIFTVAGGAYVAKPTIHVVPAAPPTFAPTQLVTEAAAFTRPRAGARLLLLDDQRLLVIGGQSPQRSPPYATAELLSLADGTSRELALASPRSAATATRLGDGRILIAGGGSATAELFDPTTMASVQVAPMTTARAGAAAALLPNGRVVVLGGLIVAGSAVGEVFDPAAGTWGTLAAPPLGVAAIAPLEGTRFLVAATQGGPTPRPAAAYYVFDSSTWRFTALPPPRTPRWSPQLVALGEGRVMVLAGHFGPGIIQAVDVFDLATRRFDAMPPVPAMRLETTAVRLASGRVLVIGGGSLTSGAYSADLFDPATRSWHGLPAVRPGITPLGALARRDGSAIVVGMRAAYVAAHPSFGAPAPSSDPAPPVDPTLVSLFNRAASHARAGDHDTALAAYRQVLEMQRTRALAATPRFLATIHLHACYALMDLQRYAEAEAELLLVELSDFKGPMLYEYYFTLGNLLGALGRIRPMFAAFVEAISAAEIAGDLVDRPQRCWTKILGVAVGSRDWPYVVEVAEKALNVARLRGYSDIEHQALVALDEARRRLAQTN